VKRLDLLTAVLAALVVAVWAPKAFAPGAAVYRDILSELVLLRLGAVAKILFLGVATVSSHRIASAFEAGNPARRAWRLLGIGLVGFLLGQGYLAFYQFVLGRSSPYPSPADLGFVAGYPFLLAAFWSFIHAYRESGFPVGSAREHLVIALAAAAVFLGVGAITLRPALSAAAPPLEKALNAGYPAFDFLILIPVLILLRITLAFRGGRVAAIWAALLAGFVFMCAGDILYAYFSTLGQAWLEPLLDALYMLAYLLMAQATLKQHAALRS
jgi:hypothetical protein